MSQKTPSDSQAARISYLEENRRFTRNSLEVALSLGDFQKQIHKQASHEQVFEETQARVNKLIPFDISALYLVDQETSDLTLSLCAPEEQTEFVEKQMEFLIDNGFMAWAIREPRGVTTDSEDHDTVIFLHVIATYSRIRGVFVGFFSGRDHRIQDISYDLTSIVLRNAANALESIEYYRLLDRQGILLKKSRDELELRVTQRTAELTRANEKLQKEVEERKKAEKNKALLLKEIHHRVKNNMQIILSLLKMQARQIDDPAFLKACTDSQDRIFSMALVHEQLYQSKNLSRIDFKAYVSRLVRNLRATCKSQVSRVQTTIEVKDVFMDIDVAIPCGLIINELVSNAFKYAFPEGRSGRLTLKMHPMEAPEMVMLVVRDDGVGMPDTTGSDTLGVRLVNNLVTHQLSGRVEMVQTRGHRIQDLFQEYDRVRSIPSRILQGRRLV
jgi:two-component sensor histidine kinase